MFRKILNSRLLPWVGAIAALAWVAVIVASGNGWNPFHARWDFSNSGTFGDSFGPLSAMMAAVAAIIALSAFRNQREEIARLQQREVENDLRQRRSEFEQTFFQLLQAFRNIVSETDVQSGPSTKQGRDAFRAMISKFENDRNRLGNTKDAWIHVSNYYKNDLNHYFRFMYHIVNFVNSSDVEDKYFYTRILRASLSESELTLLALNCAYGEGHAKFKPLVERYAMLHNLSQRSRDQWTLEGLFLPTAFERVAG